MKQRGSDKMRKIIAALILLLMMTGVAFAEGDTGAEPEMLTGTGLISLDDVEMSLDQTEYEWTGAAIEPAPILKYNGEALGENEYSLQYLNNIDAGTATVTAVFSGRGRFEAGEKSLDFTIKAKPQLEPADLSKATMTLKSSTYYKTGSAISPEPVLTYNGKTLVKGTHYTLAYSNNVNAGTATVKATAIEGSGYKGTKSASFTILPAKPAAATIQSVRSSKPYVAVTWKNVNCTGYQLQVSRNSDFSNATKYTLNATTKKIPKLKNGKKYYFRVIAYNTENGKTTYGSWSKTSSKVKTTGPVGNKYSKDGIYIKNKTIKYGGNYYYYNAAGLKSGCSKTMWKKVKNNSSKTKYLIAVDCTKNRTCIYQGKKGAWKLKSYWKCTTGKKSTPTIKGNFKVSGKVSHFGEQKGYTVWYATRVKYEYYFHSILYKPWSKSAVRSGALGKNKSHGCIRLKLANAKWIYQNCKGGTRIVIY